MVDMYTLLMKMINHERGYEDVRFIGVYSNYYVAKYAMDVHRRVCEPPLDREEHVYMIFMGELDKVPDDDYREVYESDNMLEVARTQAEKAADKEAQLQLWRKEYQENQRILELKYNCLNEFLEVIGHTDVTVLERIRAQEALCPWHLDDIIGFYTDYLLLLQPGAGLATKALVSRAVKNYTTVALYFTLLELEPVMKVYRDRGIIFE